jgi:S-adenosylmethionine:tRNA ribosyltransferase-isomerase
MKLEEFDFDLPAAQIAQRPLPERDASRLLLLERRTGLWQDRWFRELPELLHGNELVVLNNVRVHPVRLLGRRAGLRAQPTGLKNRAAREFLSAPIEVLLVREVERGLWEALVRPGRKIPIGETLVFDDGGLTALVEKRGEFGMRLLRFSVMDDLRSIFDRIGHIPLPPYIRRADDPDDHLRYQTVFARQGTAAAAPTAGLHFTPEVLSRLRARGIEIGELTLDVGLGTFAPIRGEEVERHVIHKERYEIPEETAAAIERARRDGRPIVAVGTTVVRALEDAAEKQAGRVRSALSKPGEPVIATGAALADIYLYPGRPFRVVDAMLTNFHLPRSSLLVMVAAFAGGEAILAAYRHAVSAGYRFYSYGDCMLISSREWSAC